MRISKCIAMSAVLAALCGNGAFAQRRTLHFHPGEWQIDSTTTVAGGRPITSSTHLCAREQVDFWKVAQTGLACKPPKTHPESSGKLRVRVQCEYSGSRLHSKIRSDAVETFFSNGDDFTLVGTTRTDTVYQGVQPKRTSAHLQATAHRIGNCP